MRVLVTGASGQLGYDCVQWLTAHGVTCCGVDREDFDLTDAQMLDYFGERPELPEDAKL